MTREQYLVKRNNMREVDASLIYSYYAMKCRELGYNVAPIQVFVQAINLYPDSKTIIDKSYSYYDELYGVVEMSALKNGQREVIKYI